MRDALKENFELVLLVGVVLIIIGAIVSSVYFETKQRLDCYDVNKHRTAAEAAMLCK